MPIIRIFVASFLVVAALVLFSVQQVRAEVVVTDELVTKIRTNCVKNLASLNRLHKNDAFLRNDRGELYQTISGKLMVPLNQRLTTNELDGSELIATTAEFSKEYRQFYEAYITYDNRMSELLEVDCTKSPVTFYTKLDEARTARTKVNKSDQKLIAFINQYYDEFVSFRGEFKEEQS